MLKPFACLSIALAGNAAVAACIAQAQARAPAHRRIVLQSESVDLPTDEGMFPGDKAAEAINTNCLTCHSAGMVLNQPALPRATWDAEVHKMIKVYKAPVADQDVPAIVAYLTARKASK